MHQDVEDITTIEEGVDYDIVEVTHTNGVTYRRAVLKGTTKNTDEDDVLEAYERAMKGL